MANIIDRQAAFTGTKDVADSLRFDEGRLSAWLEANVAGFEGPLSRAPIQGRAVQPDLSDRGAVWPLCPAPQAAG